MEVGDAVLCEEADEVEAEDVVFAWRRWEDRAKELGVREVRRKIEDTYR